MDYKQKIRAEIERRMDDLYQKLPDATYVLHESLTTDEANITGKYTALESILSFIDSLPEESADKELEEADKEWLIPQLDKSYANYGEAKMMELTHFDGYAMLDAIEFGVKWQKAKDESTTEDLGDYITELSKQFQEVSFAKLSRIAVRAAKWQKENLWKDAEGEYLPETDREVIVLIQDFSQHPDSFKVGFGHRPNPDGWDAKSITTEKIEHYTPKTYGKGGWNIPNVKYWLDCSMPKAKEG